MVCFAVIVLHVSAGDRLQLSTESFEWQVHNIFNACSRWCVPVFVMISGAFFLDPAKEIPTQRIFRKYIPRRLIALVLLTLATKLCGIGYRAAFKHEPVTVDNFLEILLSIPFGPPDVHP